jgi:dUTP pyrophosphatase
MNKDIINRAKKYHTPFAVLKMYVSNDALKANYMEAIQKHNNEMENNRFPNSGFDLFLPEDYIFKTKKGKIDFEVKCEMQTYHHIEDHESDIVEINPTAFYLMPRSSISKKPIMLANSIGLIDSGYRGNLMGVFVLDNEQLNELDVSLYKLFKHERIIQIVHPCTYRVFVQLVDSIDELTNTERGDGGFGSTGI